MVKVFFQRMRGREQSPARKPLSKIIWSWLGAFLGIYLVAIISTLTPYSLLDNLYLVASFGATAVLLYGVPQGELSQPRNLIGGHILSAIVGVTIYKYIHADLALLSALSVSISILAMHLTRTLHPPGGATALIAVIGGEQVHAAGYMFVLTPIASASFVMLIVALFVNNLSANPKRHYPAFWL